MKPCRSHRYAATSVLGILSLMATIASSAPEGFRQAAQAGSDVSISMSADRRMVKAGQNVTYTVTMTNPGPADATFVDVAIAIPDSLQVVSMSCDPGISPDGPFCGYSSLPAGASVVSTLVATPRTAALLHSRIVMVSASVLFEDAGASDLVAANNAAAVRTRLIGRLFRP